MTHDTDKKPNATRTKDAGFSLVELLVTVSIMALLATAVVISVGPVLSKSRIDRARADIAALESGLEQYSFDMFNYDVYSAGPDGEPENDDDIGNWN